jgi:hypothetical protein
LAGGRLAQDDDALDRRQPVPRAVVWEIGVGLRREIRPVEGEQRRLNVEAAVLGVQAEDPPGGGVFPSACWRKASSTAAMHASGVSSRSTSLRDRSNAPALRDVADVKPEMTPIPSLINVLLPREGDQEQRLGRRSSV